MADMMPMLDVEAALRTTGIDRIDTIHASTYKDCSTVVVVPTRGLIHHRVVASWQCLQSPMNQKRAFLFCTGAEVGDAYNRMIEQILANPELSKWKFVLCLEDDNLPPGDAHIRLLETLDDRPELDAVGGLYWTKGDVGYPLALGDAERYSATGELDFRPVDLRAKMANGHVVEVNGLPQGCTLFRMDLFRQVPGPWFVSYNEKGSAFTQDLYFWNRAKPLGKRCAIDMRVRVGHLDTASGIVY